MQRVQNKTMIPIELIGTGVASIATILGGVWFILNKTFGAAKMVHRIEELDTRTRGASCTHHSNVITDLRDEIKEMHTDVVTIKVILATTNKEAAAIFSIKNSPRELNSSGKRLLADVDGMSFLRKYKDVLFADMDTYTPKTALDVEAASFGTCMSCVAKEMFNEFKNFVYKSPTYLVKDASGQEKSHDISILDICFVLSLPLRDMYLKAHPEILVE